ncbi:adhesin [Paenibacillus sp. IHBB 3054]|uniref:adhesin n=1 Tax=Paenibacillus sp. IHBB 3054 TaxID=3425689 RepID=UPI003F67681A
MIITEPAKGYIERIMKEAGVETLRISQAAGGCCGLGVQLSLEKPMETDLVSTINGLQVSIDSEVFEVSRVLILDFVQDEQGEGLIITGGTQTDCC